MNLDETNRLLTVLQQIDKRIIDDPTVIVWQELLHDLPLDDCVRAATGHYRESTEYLMPVHIVAGARAIQRERIRQANEAKALASRPAEDDRPLSDRSQDIQDFVNSVRAGLPDTSADILSYGNGHWRKVREARERAEQAEPNPHFDPTVLARLVQSVPEQ